MGIDGARAFKYEPYLQAAVPCVKRAMRPAWRTWLALVAAFIGSLLWLKSDDLVVWLMAYKVVGEGATWTLSDDLRTAGTATVAAGIFAMFGWRPTSSLAIAVVRASGPPVSWTAAALTGVLRGAMKAIALLNGRLKVGVEVANQRIAEFVQRGWSRSMAGVLVLTSTATMIGIAIGQPLGLRANRVWQQAVSIAAISRRVTKVVLLLIVGVALAIVWIIAAGTSRVAHYARSVISHTSGVVRAGAGWAIGRSSSIGKSGASWTIRQTRTGLDQMATGARFVAHPVGVSMRTVWHKAWSIATGAWDVSMRVARKVGSIAATSLRTLLTPTTEALKVTLTVSLVGALKTGSFAGGMIASGGGYLIVAGGFVATTGTAAAIFTALVLTAAAAHIWALIAFISIAIGKGARISWLKATIAAGYFWRGITAVSRFLARTATAGTTRLVAGGGFVAKRIGVALHRAWVQFNVIARHIRKGVTAVARTLGGATATAASYVWAALGFVANEVGLTLHRVWMQFTAIARHIGKGVTGVAGHIWETVAAATRTLVGLIASAATQVWEGLSIVANGMGLAAHWIWLRITPVVRYIWRGAVAVARDLGTIVSAVLARTLAAVGVGVGVAIRASRIAGGHATHGASGIARVLYRGLTALTGFLTSNLRIVVHQAHVVVRRMGHAGLVALTRVAATLGTLARYAYRTLSLIAHQFVTGISVAATGVAWFLGQMASHVWAGTSAITAGFVSVGRIFWIGTSAVPDVTRFALQAVRRQPNKKGVSAMSEFKLNRKRLQSLVITMVVFALIGAGVIRITTPPPPEPTVEVVHWANGHLTREGLLVEMAEEFNAAGHRDENGTKIVVTVFHPPSELQAEYLIQRINHGTRLDLNKVTNGYVDKNIKDPTIVTPSSAHWLVKVNYQVGSYAVDIDGAQSIVRPVIGIVTYEEMARCLGWPEKKIGFADIIALREDPAGWTSYPCADPEWGTTPLLAFTDPTTSSTGRSLHLALYLIAAGKANDPASLTENDVLHDPDVVAYVKEFQGLIDRYQIGTTALNTRIYQGPRYGHFFVMPEDNLIHLYEGTESAYVLGKKETAPPIEDRMVMIYPEEGAMPRNNCACIVRPEVAIWVTEEQVAAAGRWIEFIRQDEQQRAFMAAGFRPGTDIDLDDPASKITREFGLDSDQPKVVVEPSLIESSVAAAIDDSWEQVKRPGIVTFVVDTSGSMLGGKIDQARDGMYEAMRVIAQNNRVGFVTFSDEVNTTIPVAPLAENRYEIANAIERMRARGETALNDAIKTAIEMTDAAEGPEDAIRGVVVLTDGRANRCETRLDEIIEMESVNEQSIREFSGCGDSRPVQAGGNQVAKSEVIGTQLVMAASNPVQVFYIGIGEDADLDVGRMLAGATGGAFQAGSEEDLAQLLAEFAKWL